MAVLDLSFRHVTQFPSASAVQWSVVEDSMSRLPAAISATSR